MSERGLEQGKVSISPWAFVPLMYFLQAIPVALVQEVATIVYKDLGIANEEITRWTSIVALPWSLQMLLGPLVDLSGTRRQWVVRAQLAISAALVVLPFLLRLPQAFSLSLGAFLVAAIFSALCNAAMDGFYLLSLPKDAQARFAGVQTTCYRLGTLFAKGLLVLLAGKLLAFGEATITNSAGMPPWTIGTVVLRPTPVVLTVRGGTIVDQEGKDAAPGLRLPADASHVEVRTDGAVVADGAVVGQLRAKDVTPVEFNARMSPRDAWTAALLGGGLIFTVLYFVERRAIPRPEEDVPAPEAPGELQKNIVRTLSVVGLGISGYFTANALLRLLLNWIGSVVDGGSTGPLQGWHLADNGSIVGFAISGPGIYAELVQFGLAGVIAVSFAVLARRSIRKTAMADAFGSFFRQPGIVAILSFLMFYRFGEAMVMKMSPLFLKDSPASGGLGLGTDTVGTIKGVVGVFGIVLGGILGGLVVSKFGLRRSIWPLAICMHLPNLLYLWASLVHPPTSMMFGVDFVEQFGYGFGFAGYTIVLQRLAQRGNYRTAHYALGVGVGALFIQIAGVASGVIQANVGYTGFFVASVVLALPGLATLLFLPLDEA